MRYAVGLPSGSAVLGRLLYEVAHVDIPFLAFRNLDTESKGIDDGHATPI